jgi:hypothetical protein
VNGSSAKHLNEESERTLEEQRNRKEELETVSYEMSPVVPITLKTYTPHFLQGLARPSPARREGVYGQDLGRHS